MLSTIVGGDTAIAQQPYVIQSNLNSLHQQGILLLRNGQLMAGRYSITPYGYQLSLTSGGVVRLVKEQVEFVSESMDEVYAYRRASKVIHSAEAHLEMANWCLRNHLYEYAQTHLQQAIRINPRQSGIIPVQSRLAIARETSKRPQIPSVRPQTTVVSNEVISRRIDQLDPSVIRSFVGGVQPLLLNTCAVAGCHGPNARSTYQLIQARWTKTIPRNISYRNLYNTLTHVDFLKPENSPLLTQATSAHGGSKTPKLSIANSQRLSILVNWVRVATAVGSADTLPQPPGKPIIFKADAIQHLREGSFEKVLLPGADTGTKDAGDQPGDQQRDASPSKPLTETTLSERFRSDKIFQPKSFSSDWDSLPLQESADSLLKVFSPPPPSRRNLTPGIQAKFPLPSDFLLKPTKPRASD